MADRRLVLGVKLHAHEPPVLGQLDDLDEVRVRVHAREAHPFFAQLVAQDVVDLVAVAVAFVNRLGRISLDARPLVLQARTRYCPRRIVRPDPSRFCCSSIRRSPGAASPGRTPSVGVRAAADLCGRTRSWRICIPRQIPRNGTPCSRAYGTATDLPLDAAARRSRRHQDRIVRAEHIARLDVGLEVVGVHKFELHVQASGDARVHEASVMDLYASSCSTYLPTAAMRTVCFGGSDPPHNGLPGAQVTLGAVVCSARGDVRSSPWSRRFSGIRTAAPRPWRR